MIGKIILGICFIICAVVIVKPEYADMAWSFAMALFTIACILGIGVVVIIIIVILILVLA